MTFKDEPFEFYELPYRHNEKNYARYINQNKSIDFNKYHYYPYLVSTPYEIDYKKTRSDYEVKVAILIKDKKTSEISLDFETFDFKSLLRLNTFAKINETGDITLFEQLKKRFSKLINEKEIHISDTEQLEVLSLEEVANRFGILDKCDIHLKNEFKNLEYYLYIVDGKNILIPAMEILKYFYIYDYQGKLVSHFSNNVLTKQGIKSSCNYIDVIGNHYNFEIHGDYSSSDRYKILFFITNPKRHTMYSSVYDTFKRDRKISARIPRKELDLKIRGYDYKDKNLLLVLNIIKHDHSLEKDFPTKPTFHYTHAKSGSRENDEGKRDKSKDIKKSKASNDSMDFDDSKYGNNELEYDRETKDNFKFNIESNKIDVKVNLKGTIEKKEQRTQQGGKVISEDKGDAPITSKRSIGNQDHAVSNISEDLEEKKDDFKITINEVVKYIQDNSDFKFIEHKNYIYPIVITDSGKEKKTSFMFIDKKKKIKRKYDIVKVKYQSYILYIIELQTKLNGTTKSILTLIDNSDTLSIDFVNDRYIEEELIDFINNKDRSWFSGKLNMNESKFFTFKPSGSMQGYKNKLKRHIEKVLKK